MIGHCKGLKCVDTIGVIPPFAQTLHRWCKLKVACFNNTKLEQFPHFDHSVYNYNNTTRSYFGHCYMPNRSNKHCLLILDYWILSSWLSFLNTNVSVVRSWNRNLISPLQNLMSFYLMMWWFGIHKTFRIDFRLTFSFIIVFIPIRITWLLF